MKHQRITHIYTRAGPMVDTLSKCSIEVIDIIGTSLSILLALRYVRWRTIERRNANEQESAGSVIIQLVHVLEIGVKELWDPSCRIRVLV